MDASSRRTINGHIFHQVTTPFTAGLLDIVCLLEEVNRIYSSQYAAMNLTNHLPLSQKEEASESIVFT